MIDDLRPEPVVYIVCGERPTSTGAADRELRECGLIDSGNRRAD